MTSLLLALLEDLVSEAPECLSRFLTSARSRASAAAFSSAACALFGGEGRKSHAYVTSDVELSDTDR